MDAHVESTRQTWKKNSPGLLIVPHAQRSCVNALAIMDLLENSKPYAVLPSKHHKYTIRALFEKYRDNGGACWVEADPPEYSVTSETNEITCMTRMKYFVGLPHLGVYVGPPPTEHRDLEGVMRSAMKWVENAINTGYLWCPPGCTKVETDSRGRWGIEGSPLDKRAHLIMKKVESCGFVPLSVSTVHSALESDKVANVRAFSDLYPFPRTTTPSTSLFGTAHNNAFIDMSPLEKDKEPDMDAREFRDEHIGFICAPYTSHSYEAGRSRRVTTDVLVRLLEYKTYAALEGMSSRESSSQGEKKDWLVWCSGHYCGATRSTVNQLCIYHRLKSMCDDPGFGLYIREEKRVCVVFISSGTLTKLCTNGVWSDNINAHISDRVKFSISPHIATSGPDFHRSCLSSHYSYIPFVEHNAAIRTSISAAQITQAVCLPYCPATAAVSPCHVFNPIVTTPTYKRIMVEQETELDMASYMPGETVCVLYHNLPLGYEDAIIVSKRYVEYGGFSTTSTCRYLLPATDYVPPVGKMVCSRLSKWWKSQCQSYCRHTVDFIENCNTISPFGPPTGVIASRRILKTGEQSVKVTSYETFQPGNKLSTGHGQKGVDSVVLPYEDMPICHTKSGEQIVPDVIMAVASIVNRQTVGQIYESGAGIMRLKNPNMDRVVLSDEISELGEDVSVMNGTTGEFYKTVVARKDKDGNIDSTAYMKEAVATIGYVRMFNQSQMTRERLFTSHRSMGPHTLRTPTKRSRGGALNEGEMEIQALVASGLVNCAEELRKRGDEVVVLVCMQCQRLRLLHSCTSKTEFAEVTLPYDMVVLDCVNKIVYNIAFKYTLEPDV